MNAFVRFIDWLCGVPSSKDMDEYHKRCRDIDKDLDVMRQRHEDDRQKHQALRDAWQMYSEWQKEQLDRDKYKVEMDGIIFYLPKLSIKPNQPNYTIWDSQTASMRGDAYQKIRDEEYERLISQSSFNHNN